MKSQSSLPKHIQSLIDIHIGLVKLLDDKLGIRIFHAVVKLLKLGSQVLDLNRVFLMS